MQVNATTLPSVNWDDLRLVLTIARCGSLNAAAAELEVNVSTASRRLNQVEVALGILCFVRRPSGIEPTPAGQLVIEHATEIEQQTLKMMRAAAGEHAASSRTVTITSPDSLSTAIVIPAIAERQGEHHCSSVNLITDNRILDLHRGEADLALRLRRPANGGLRIRKIAEVTYGLFAAETYLARIRAPQSLKELSCHKLIGMRTIYPHHASASWWEENCQLGRVSLRTDRTLDRQVAAESGLGITMLPVAVGQRSSLTRILRDEELPRLEVFLLAEPGALRVREVREIADCIASYSRRRASLV